MKRKEEGTRIAIAWDKASDTRGLKTTLPCMLFILLTLACNQVHGQQNAITEKNIRFIKYPGFYGSGSTWGDIGYDPRHNKVYIGVTNHVDSVGLYEYDVAGNDMRLRGFIADMANLRSFQWQGKVHSKFVADREGNMYFSTDGGDMRHLDFMDGPHGYAGGFLLKWDPVRKALTNLGMGLQYESMKDIDIDPETGKIYAVTFPQVHFLVYDTKTNKLQDFGRLGGSHVPRVLFTDRWGNCYYVDWRQRLVKYEKCLDKLVFSKESLPAFPGTPGISIITGITAFARNKDASIIYLVTYGAKLLAFYPEKTGIGKVEDLGGVFDSEEQEKWNYYVPNLNLGDNDKLYYIVGGHGSFAKKDKTLLMEFDPKSRNKKILLEYFTSTLGEVTGSDIKDKEGHLYFAGRTDSLGISKPFMIRFHPDKEVK